ncbi:MAG: hypothetical protein K5931_03725 [Lachnospiraceae bacterium]|nr:hypothetical protein [Lachnospiraceae bacterium]
MKIFKEKITTNQLIIVLLSIAVIMLAAFGITRGKYYKQYGNPEIAYDETSGRYHTPYLSVKRGKVKVIIGYHAFRDLKIKIADDSFDIEATKGDGEDFREFPLLLESYSDLFTISLNEEDKDSIEIYEYELIFEKPYNNDGLYIGIILLLMLSAFMFFYSKSSSYEGADRKERLVILIALLAGIILSSLPMFRDYLVYGHDLMGQLKRIEGLKDGLMEGHIIPVVYPNVNNGYGEMGFCYPYLFLYIPALLRCASVSMPLAYGTFIFLINAATGIIMYSCVFSMTGKRRASAIAAFVYLLNPYRLTDIYVRAALGESLAMTFLPLVVCGIYHILFGDKRKYYLMSLGLLCIFSSHILTTGLAGIFLIIILILNIKMLFEERRFIELIKAGVMFFPPVLLYFLLFNRFSPYINMGDIKQIDFYRYAVFLAQLFMSDSSTYVMLEQKEGIGDEFIQGIGLVGALILALIIYYYVNKKETKEDFNRRFFSSLVFSAVLFLYASTVLCPWNILNKVGIIDTITGMIQFPFRFLTIVSVLLSILAAIIIDECFTKRESLYTVTAMVFLLSVFGVQDTLDNILRQPLYLSDISGGFSSYSNKEYYLKGLENDSFRDTDPHGEGVNIKEYEKKGSSVYLTYENADIENSDAVKAVTLPLLYYPGYTAKDQDGRVLETIMGEGGRVKVILPAEEGSIKLYYSLFKIF